MPGAPFPGPGPRPSRSRKSVYGGRPLALPLVVTLPARNVEHLGADLVAAINPQGSDTTWWFEWGTTTAYGNTTPVEDAGAGSISLTFDAIIGGMVSPLVEGTTYHFAIVATSAAGTVYGQDVSFVAVDVPTNDVTVPFQLAPTEPHFAYPFVLTSIGAITYQQDSVEEIASCMLLIASCPQGSCADLPNLGVPDITFTQVPPDPATLLESLEAQESRATMEVLTMALGDLSVDWTVSVEGQVAGSVLSGT